MEGNCFKCIRYLYNVQLQNKLTINNGNYRYGPLHALKAHRENKVTNPIILNLGISLRWTIGFTFRPLYPQEKLSVLIEWEAG